MSVRFGHCAIAAALVAMPAAGQEAPSRHERAMAAGYKAAFTCSATFNAGRSLDQIAAGELARIYPGYRDVLADLPDAVIDAEAQTVSVTFADDMPPRIAAWRPHLGCAQLPPGAGMEMADRLPRVEGLAELDAAPAPWPAGDGSEIVAPPPALAALVDTAFDASTYGEGTLTTAVVVVRDGRLIAEQYTDGFGPTTSQRTWSVAKSIAATVIGAGVHQGLLEVDATAPVPEWSAPGDPRSTITLANLLHMSSGLDSGVAGNRTDRVYFGGGLVKENAAGKSLEARPGARWKYANNDTLLALRSLRAAIGDDAAYLRFPFEAVLHPLGMGHTFLETDWGGDFIGSSQIWTTARDLARVGQLYLNDGLWEGERLLPEGWADYVRTPAPVQPESGEWGYGAQFWLVGGLDGLPDDAFTAAGHRGQYVVIVPSADLVIVRRGFDESGGTGFDITGFSGEVLAAFQ